MRVKNLILILGVIVAYLGIIGYVRMSNDRTIEKRYYQVWREDYIKNQSESEQYVNAAGKNKPPFALSEAQGYGMLLAVKAGQRHLGSQNDFQKLDNYYLRHRLSNSNLMSWRQENKKGSLQDNPVSASDGDMMIAQALLEADKVWPGHGYKAQALKLISDIKKLESNRSAKIITVGNWANKKSHFYNVMRTSDVMPQAFEEFYQATGDHSWIEIKSQMLAYLQQLSSQHKTGLVPDFTWISKQKQASPAKANDIATKDDGNYSANACRVPMLLAASNDKEANNIVKKMLSFFKQKEEISSGFTLSGKTLYPYESASFSAPIFVAASKYQNEGYGALVEHEKYIFSRPLPANNYYDATLIVLAALNTNELTGLEK